MFVFFDVGFCFLMFVAVFDVVFFLNKQTNKFMHLCSHSTCKQNSQCTCMHTYDTIKNASELTLLYWSTWSGDCENI